MEAFGLRKIDIQSTKCWTPNPEFRQDQPYQRRLRLNYDTLEFTGETKRPNDFSLVSNHFPWLDVSGLDIFLYLVGVLLSFLHSQSIGGVSST